MWLEARQGVAVSWPGGGRDFAAGDGIRTEISVKWDDASLSRLWEAAGAEPVGDWRDEQGWFAVLLARLGTK
jgi:uncharacterized SAM-dependent methyltransferase